MEQRPAAMVALDAAQIDADLALQLEVIRLAEIVAQQDVLGRDGRVGLQLEDPVAVVALLAQQRLRGAADVVARARRQALDVGHRARRVASAESECGRGLARAQRALDGRRQAGVGPVAGQEQVGPRGSRAAGRRASCAGVAAKVARFSLTMRQGGTGPSDPWTAATSRHSSCGQGLALGVDQMVGGADGDGEAVVKGEDPFRRAADHADHGSAASGGGAMRKWALRMARNASGASDAGQQLLGDPGRHREDHAIVRPSVSSPSSKAKADAPGRRRTCTAAQPAARRMSAPVRAQLGERGVDESGGEARRGDQRAHVACRPWRGFRARSAPARSAEAALRRRVQRRQQDRPQELLPQGPCRSERPRRSAGRDGAAAAAQQRQIVAMPCVPGTRRRAIENPPGQRPVVRAQGPALARCKVDERELGRAARPAGPPRRWRQVASTAGLPDRTR